MELKYKELPESEGGAALPDCGTIHISEVRPTLEKLSLELGFSVDLNDYTMGSTGKREYSGDVDIVLDKNLFEIDFIRDTLIKMFGNDNVARNGGMIHLRHKIENYDPSFNKHSPRTGFVQVDFSVGNVAWEKFYHYSPGAESEYKGAHRNLCLAAITSSANTVDSLERDTYSRPIEQIRWKWSPKGFMKVNRISKVDKRSGAWMKKQEDTIIEGPYFDPATIAKIVFPEDGNVNDFSSLETLVAAVKRNYGFTDQERIWKRMSENFRDWKDGKNFIYPLDIDKYFSIDDK